MLGLPPSPGDGYQTHQRRRHGSDVPASQGEQEVSDHPRIRDRGQQDDGGGVELGCGEVWDQEDPGQQRYPG